MNTLIKDTVDIGSVGTPGDPGSVGTPDTLVTVCRTYTPYTLVFNSETGQYILTPGAPRTVCETRTIEGTDPVPPTPGTQPDPEILFNLGWNAGAQSIGSLSGDGWFEFSVPKGVVGVVAGLNNDNVDADYRNIDYGLYFSDRTVKVVENGVIVGPAFTYATTDVFYIERAGFTISYWKGATRLYTSLVPSYGTVIADCSLYSGGDSILDPALVTPASKLPRTGSSSASFLPMETLAADHVYAESTTEFEELTTSITARTAVEIASSFMPMETLAANKGYAEASVSFRPLTTDVRADYEELAPTYALSYTSFVEVIGFSHGLTGGTNINTPSVFEPMETLATNKPYATTTPRSRFLPMETLALDVPAAMGWAALTCPMFTLNADATQIEPNAFRGEMPFSFAAYGGAQARVSMPAPLFVSTGIGMIVGRVYAEMPLPTLVSSGKVGSIGQIDARLRDRFSLRAFSGAVVQVTLQDGFSLEADVNTGTVGRVRVRMPLFELVASGTVNGLNSADLLMPMLVPVPSGVARLTLPGYDFVAVGSVVVSLTAADFEAYTMNIVDRKHKAPNEEVIHEVTRYTNFPFNQIVRYGDKYLGVGSDGLYELTGDTDLGEPIQWLAETAVTDFGTHNHKTAVSVYMSGVVTKGLTVSVTTDKRTTYAYPYTTPRDAFPQNHRQKFGKGLKATYYSFTFSDPQGRNFELNNAEFEISTLKRAV